MKNVLPPTLFLTAIACVSCAVGASPSGVASTATATLRSFPSASPTHSPGNLDQQEDELISSDPTATPFVHVIQEGDTMLSIALRYGVGLEELVLVNPGIDPRFLTVGESLRIPGPEGEAVDVLLPTPTPVPLTPSAVRCFRSLIGELRCLSMIRNDRQVAIEAISGIIGLYDGQGELLVQKSSDSPLRFLPPGETMPLAVVFNEVPPGYSSAKIQILSAIQINPEVSRFMPVDLKDFEWELLDGKAGASVTAMVSLPEDIESGTYLLKLLGMVEDGVGQVVGFRIIEEVIDFESADSIELQFIILSLGPEVESIHVIAEFSNLD